MSKPRVAHAVICDSKTCSPRDLLVRGDHVSFVSTEQAERTGIHSLDDQKMPSDIVLPKEYVLVQDPTGKWLRKCDFFILRYGRKVTKGSHISTKIRTIAADYFGQGAKLEQGSVDIPEKSWHRSVQIAFIRYRRAGELSGSYEHPYKPHVWLYTTEKPLAWRVALPNGCVVDGRGFVWP